VSRLRRKTSKLATASARVNKPRTPSLSPSFLTGKKFVRLTLWPLVAATFFMVSGGTTARKHCARRRIRTRDPDSAAYPAALESADGLHDRELSSALPYEGGYYAWVRRAMEISGDFKRHGSRW